MKDELIILSLTIEAPAIINQSSLSVDMLFSHFKPLAIELLKKESCIVNHFGWIPDNGADGIDEFLTNGTFFRFDVPQDMLDVNLDSDHIIVKQAFLTVVENREPVYSVVSEEKGNHKIEKTIIFDFSGL